MIVTRKALRGWSVGLLTTTNLAIAKGPDVIVRSEHDSLQLADIDREAEARLCDLPVDRRVQRSVSFCTLKLTSPT